MKSKICLFALPLLLGALILSCQDEMTGGSENKVQDVVLNATIEKAKTKHKIRTISFETLPFFLCLLIVGLLYHTYFLQMKQ